MTRVRGDRVRLWLAVAVMMAMVPVTSALACAACEPRPELSVFCLTAPRALEGDEAFALEIVVGDLSEDRRLLVTDAGGNLLGSFAPFGGRDGPVRSRLRLIGPDTPLPLEVRAWVHGYDDDDDSRPAAENEILSIELVPVMADF